MEVSKNENQYFRVAKEAYGNIVRMKMPIDEAWSSAATNNITSEESRNKGCPGSTFIGLYESGDLRDVKQTKQSDRINYQYAKFAISEWKKYPAITKKEMCERVVSKFSKAKNHQAQLDVLKGIWGYLR
jgi:hypothetical protein